MKKKILSWLLHNANRLGKNDDFYKIKNRILKNYGTPFGFDVQFIEGKKCYSCDGEGNYFKYSWYEKDGGHFEQCYNCWGGWYKRPHWNVLQKIKFGKYVFHQPLQRVYKEPVLNIGIGIIEGYIEHIPAKHSRFALTVLFILYDKNYWSREWKSRGNYWNYCYKYWYKPNQIINRIIYLIKHIKAKKELSELPF